MKIAFSTLACAAWDLPELLERAQQYGYEGVEIRFLAGTTDLLNVPHFLPENLDHTRQLLAAAKAEVACLASSVRFDYLQAGELEHQTETGRRFVDLCQQLRIGKLRVFGDSIPEPAMREQIIAQVAEGLNRIGEYAQPRGVQVVIETHGDFSDSATMQEMMQRVESPAAGVLWDTHHPWRFYGERPSETFARIGPWVRHTHWKDSVTQVAQEQSDAAAGAAAQAHALMSGHRHADYVLFGQGEFPAAEVVALLEHSGYDGWYSLEWEKEWHPELAPPEVALPPFPAALRKCSASK